MGKEHKWEIWEIRTEFYSEEVKGRDHLEDLVVDGR
jgi:hypothetical protein